MKKQLLLLVAMFLVSAGFNLKAQSVDEILNTYFENIGGKAKWKKVNTITTEGKMTVQGQNLPFKSYRTRPNLMRKEMNFRGKTLVQQAFDGKNAWGTNPRSGQIEKKSAEETKLLAAEELEPYYLDYKSKGHKIELAGTEEIDGTACFKLKATKKNGDVEYLFFDSENMSLIMSRSTLKTGPAKGMQSDTYYSDYDLVNGLSMPHKLIQSFAGQKVTINLSSIKINAKVDKKIFAFPKK